MTATGTGCAVRAQGWGWRHAGRAAWAVRGLDLEIEAGSRVLLLGASGAGKSTLVHALAGVLGGAEEGESEGALLVDDIDPTAARGRAGLVLQDPDSQLVLARVGDDVAFGCENLGVPRAEIWPRVDEALAAVGLGGLALDHPTEQLSGGQKQRLALAGVLAMRPGLLLLDEPTANLDPAGVVEVRDAVAGLLESTRATVVVIEHRVDVWLDLVDRVVVLAPGGGVLADGAPDAVLREHGAELAALGVWVPGSDPLEGRAARVGTAAPVPASAAPLVAARGLGIERVPGSPVATGIELAVRPGELTALTGPNGAGKSTLALTLAGLLPHSLGTLDAGALAVDAPDSLASPTTTDRRTSRPRRVRRRDRGPRGADPITWNSRDLLTRIGTVFQDPEHQFVTGSVRAELEVGPRALGLAPEEIAERVADAAGRLRLEHLLDANPFTLSGGEKRRLSVASALVVRPRVLVLDEPTFGQDSRTWRELVLLLAEQLDRGTAVVAVTHDRSFIAALADHELRIAAGRAEPALAAGDEVRP